MRALPMIQSKTQPVGFHTDPLFLADAAPPSGGPPTELCPDVWLYRNALSEELCARLVEKFEADARRERREGMVEGPAYAHRKADMLFISNLPDWKEEDDQVAAALGAVIGHHYSSLKWPPAALSLLKDVGYDLTCYRPPADHCVIHCDGGMDNRRMTSFVVYLNDVELGGETFFPRWNLDVKPERGAVLVFPPGYTHFHGAKPPISGPRYSILTWMVWASMNMPHSHDGSAPHVH